MTRAAVFIGINRVGNLPILRDAVAGAKRLHDKWAKQQNLGPAVLITDEEKDVTAAEIQKAIETILEPRNAEQLIVYFAGHGINIHRGEYWLLSDAPTWTQAAVNVRGSEYLARYSGVNHVVFISDTCRTAADSINAQNITGTEIFPNDQVTDGEKPVDLFFACALGKPAHEVRDVNVTASQFRALYTDALTSALCFQESAVIDWAIENETKVGYIRPRPLRNHLKDEVIRRILALHLEGTVVQIPDAHISSEPEAWLSRTVDHPLPEVLSIDQGFNIVSNSPQSVWIHGPHESDDVHPKSLVSQAISNPAGVTGLELKGGPHRLGIRCGFAIRGANISSAYAIDTEITVFGSSLVLVRDDHKPRHASVLLILEDGTGITLPIIPDFMAALTIEDGDLVDVAYEPSDNSHRSSEYHERSGELWTLRSVISNATQSGSFHLEGDDALSLARRLQFSKQIDPSLAVYAAHAYNDLHCNDLLQEMNNFMVADLGASLFDVAMFAGTLDATSINAQQRKTVFGFAPLLSQGWAYLRARRIALPDGCNDLYLSLTDSLWTVFKPDGVRRLQETIFRGARAWHA